MNRHSNLLRSALIAAVLATPTAAFAEELSLNFAQIRYPGTAGAGGSQPAGDLKADGDDPQAIGMLVPAVQKVRDAAARSNTAEAGTLGVAPGGDADKPKEIVIVGSKPPASQVQYQIQMQTSDLQNAESVHRGSGRAHPDFAWNPVAQPSAPRAVGANQPLGVGANRTELGGGNMVLKGSPILQNALPGPAIRR